MKPDATFDYTGKEFVGHFLHLLSAPVLNKPRYVFWHFIDNYPLDEAFYQMERFVIALSHIRIQIKCFTTITEDGVEVLQQHVLTELWRQCQDPSVTSTFAKGEVDDA
jgi:hypothetical protein